MNDHVLRHTIATSRTARFFTIGSAGNTIDEVWIVLHGYGQNAEYFIRHFHPIAAEQRLIVAPEGLSRFYLDGFSGRVGASWMTRLEREDEIADYVRYLDKVHERITSSLTQKPTRFVILGFSQGTATACRWLERGIVQAEHLILWAGLAPPEMSPTSFQGINVSLVVGDRDQYLNTGAVSRQRTTLETANVRVKDYNFNGGHELSSDLLQNLAAGTFDKSKINRGETINR